MSDIERGARYTLSGKRRPQPYRISLPVDKRSAEALQGWFASIAGGLNIKPKVQIERDKAMKYFGINADADELVVNTPRRRQFRALALNANAAGGYLVPETFSGTVEAALIYNDPVRRVANIITTPNGRPMPWPTATDVTNAAVVVPESQPLGLQDPTAIGQLVLNAYKADSKQILIPNELLEDAPADMFMSWLGTIIGQRIALEQNQLFTTGDGTANPLGLLNAATKGPTAASPATVAWPDIVNLFHSVDAVYRQPGMRPVFMMNDAILVSLHLAVASTGSFLSWASTAEGNMWTILGCPVLPNPAMPGTPASGTKSVLFGPAEKLLIRDVNEIRIRRLVERYAEVDQTAVVGLMRSDLAVLDAGTHPWKYLQN